MLKKQLQQLKPITNKELIQQKNETITETTRNNLQTGSSPQDTNATNKTQMSTHNCKPTYAQTINQEQSLTLGQRTPTKQERQKPSKVSLNMTEETTHTPNKKQSLDRNNTKNNKIEQSPVTWTLPTPIQETKTQKPNRKQRK